MSLNKPKAYIMQEPLEYTIKIIHYTKLPKT